MAADSHRSHPCIPLTTKPGHAKPIQQGNIHQGWGLVVYSSPKPHSSEDLLLFYYSSLPPVISLTASPLICFKITVSLHATSMKTQLSTSTHVVRKPLFKMLSLSPPPSCTKRTQTNKRGIFFLKLAAVFRAPTAISLRSSTCLFKCSCL